MPIAEKVIKIELDGVERSMRFDANGFVAYEDATGKFFLDTVASLYAVMFPKGHEDADGSPMPVRVRGMEIIRKVPITDLRALLWSAIHDYDAADNPVWPLTMNQVGRLLDLKNVIPIFVRFLTGVSGNAPTTEELGESPAAERSPEPPTAASEAPATHTNGGGAGIELPAGALD